MNKDLPAVILFFLAVFFVLNLSKVDKSFLFSIYFSKREFVVRTVNVSVHASLIIIDFVSESRSSII